MDIISAIGLVTQLINAGVNAMTQAQQVSGLITKAAGEGRTEISAAELGAIVGTDDKARELLAQAIANAGGAAKPDAPGS